MRAIAKQEAWQAAADTKAAQVATQRATAVFDDESDDTLCTHIFDYIELQRKERPQLRQPGTSWNARKVVLDREERVGFKAAKQLMEHRAEHREAARASKPQQRRGEPRQLTQFTASSGEQVVRADSGLKAHHRNIARIVLRLPRQYYDVQQGWLGVKQRQPTISLGSRTSASQPNSLHKVCADQSALTTADLEFKHHHDELSVHAESLGLHLIGFVGGYRSKVSAIAYVNCEQHGTTPIPSAAK